MAPIITRGGLAAALALATPGVAGTSPGGPIPPGTYNCIAGFGTGMLTLGRMTITGTGYRFQPPTGRGSAGTYSITPGGYVWSGDIGALRHAWLRESRRDGMVADAFWFTFRYPNGSADESVSCRRL